MANLLLINALQKNPKNEIISAYTRQFIGYLTLIASYQLLIKSDVIWTHFFCNLELICFLECSHYFSTEKTSADRSVCLVSSPKIHVIRVRAWVRVPARSWKRFWNTSKISKVCQRASAMWEMRAKTQSISKNYVTKVMSTMFYYESQSHHRQFADFWESLEIFFSDLSKVFEQVYAYFDYSFPRSGQRQATPKLENSQEIIVLREIEILCSVRVKLQCRTVKTFHMITAWGKSESHAQNWIIWAVKLQVSYYSPYHINPVFIQIRSRFIKILIF